MPWVTVGLVGLCTALLLWSEFGGSAATVRAERLQLRMLELTERGVQAFEDERRGQGPAGGLLEIAEEAASDMQQVGGFQRRRRERGQRFERGELLPDDHPVYLEYLEAKRQFDAALERVPVAIMGYQPLHDGLGQMLSSLFAHGGWLHLLGNMWFLYLTGCYLEDRWGRGVYLAFYLLGGVAGCVAYAVMHPDSEVFLIGASGAIAAAMGAFTVCFATTKIRFVAFYLMLFRPRLVRFSAPAWVMLPLWLAEQLLMMSLESVTGVAHSAHVGGFLFGLTVALTYRFTDIDRSLDTHLDLEASGMGNWAGRDAFLEAVQARDRGDLPAAIAGLTQALASDAGRAEIHQEMLQACIEAKDAKVVGPSARFLLRKAYDAGDHTELSSLYRLLRRELPDYQPGDQELSWIIEAARRDRDGISVVQAAGTLLAQHPESRFAPRALWLAAEAQEQHGRGNLVRTTLQRIIDSFPEHAVAAQAKRRMVEMEGRGA